MPAFLLQYEKTGAHGKLRDNWLWAQTKTGPSLGGRIFTKRSLLTLLLPESLIPKLTKCVTIITKFV
jgi:hypothetical protein